MTTTKIIDGYEVFMDAEDEKKLEGYIWHVEKYKDKYGFRFYARAFKYYKSENGKYKRKSFRMHRLILDVENDKTILVDHVDRNGLNNTRENLRICDSSQNQANKLSFVNSSSKYKGVSWNKRENRWKVAITIYGKKYNLGSFTDESEAAKAYNRKAVELFGDFALLNEVVS